MSDNATAKFRLAVVPGVTPDRWCRTWAERRPGTPLELVLTEVAERESALRAGDVDAGLLRLPVDRDAYHAISLYTETTVVLVARDHLITAADEVTIADLAGEPLLLPADDVLDLAGLPCPVIDRPVTTSAAVELAAAGVGALMVPLSLARLHHRRDLAHRVVTDAPTSSVALVWPRDRHTDLVEEMIGIVRGRTPNSTRGRRPERNGGPSGGGADGQSRAARRDSAKPRRRGRR